MSKVTVLSSSGQSSVAKMKELFKESPFKARIYAFSEKPTKSEVIVIEDTDSKFVIVDQVETFGISTNDKIYSRKKANYKIFVNNGKFYQKSGTTLNQLTLSMIMDKKVKEYLIGKFSWIRFLAEGNLRYIAFNSIVRHKLYSLRKAMSFYYKVPYESALLINKKYYEGFSRILWKEMLKLVTHTQNINPELLQDMYYLKDCTDMAKKLNLKVNLSWSARRLKEEHDKWSRIITNVLFESTNRPLVIKQDYLELNEHIGGLITDTKSLALEGMTQNHCVGGYASNVDSGYCGIYHIEGYTLEVRHSGQGYFISQFRGHHNTQAPLELSNKIQEKINSFNQQKNVKEEKTYQPANLLF